MDHEEDSEFNKCIKIIMSNSTKSDEFAKCIDLLGMKRDQFNIIHVSGTNGKSSVSYKVSKCLISLGKNVGLFTSPHLFEYTERIRVQGVSISKEDFIRITHNILEAIGDTPVHFFSFFLLIALVYFVEKSVEWVILETGIGGLYDVTNFAPNTKVVVISSIGYDHMQMLGKTLEEIAFQKAGTIKKDSVVVLGPNCYKDEVFEKVAEKVGARIIKNNKSEFKSFDQENSETSRIVIEEALRIGHTSPFSLSSRLMSRMQILSNNQCEEVKKLVFSKFPDLLPKINEYGLPKAVVMDIGHNETAILRLCSDVFKIYSANVSFCLAISFKRRLSIFNPIGSLDFKNNLGQPVLCKIHYLNVNHDYCRKLDSVESDFDDPNLSPNTKELLKTGLERTKQIIYGPGNSASFNHSENLETLKSLENSVHSNGNECNENSESFKFTGKNKFYYSNAVTDDFDKVLYNVFIDCCKNNDLLVITGTAYMMTQTFTSLGLGLNS